VSLVSDRGSVSMADDASIGKSVSHVSSLPDIAAALDEVWCGPDDEQFIDYAAEGYTTGDYFMKHYDSFNSSTGARRDGVRYIDRGGDAGYKRGSNYGGVMQPLPSMYHSGQGGNYTPPRTYDQPSNVEYSHSNCAPGFNVTLGPLVDRRNVVVSPRHLNYSNTPQSQNNSNTPQSHSISNTPPSRLNHSTDSTRRRVSGYHSDSVVLRQHQQGGSGSEGGGPPLSVTRSGECTTRGGSDESMNDQHHHPHHQQRSITSDYCGDDERFSSGATHSGGGALRLNIHSVQSGYPLAPPSTQGPVPDYRRPCSQARSQAAGRGAADSRFRVAVDSEGRTVYQSLMASKDLSIQQVCTILIVDYIEWVLKFSIHSFYW